MKTIKRFFVTLLTVSLVLGIFCPALRAHDDPIADEWNMLDLFIARPMGVAAGIVGTVFFIASLPFTIPTGSTDRAAKILISDPFNFSFKRQFPDPDVQDGYYYY